MFYDLYLSIRAKQCGNSTKNDAKTAIVYSKVNAV